MNGHPSGIMSEDRIRLIGHPRIFASFRIFEETIIINEKIRSELLIECTMDLRYGGAVRIHRDPTTIDLLGTDNTSLRPESLRDSPNCVALLSPSGRILTVSASAIAVLGLEDQTQLLGRHWCKIWPSWTHEALSEALDRALEGKITTYWANFPNPQGVLVDWDIRISPVFDSEDIVASVLAVSRPVTKH